MKLKLGVAVGFLMMATQGHAALIGVSGPLSNLGSSASIVTSGSVGDANDDAAFNTAQQGFDEKQGVLLTSALSVDGGTIASGNRVDSHMIFLNSGPGNNRTLLEHYNVRWTFDGDILGVMSDSSGNLEVNSTPLLGAADVIYPSSGFTARGLETTNRSCDGSIKTSNDCYGIFGNELNLTMRVTEPGDWIRVVTRSAQVPEPGTLGLLGLGILALGASRRKGLARTI